MSPTVEQTRCSGDQIVSDHLGLRGWWVFSEARVRSYRINPSRRQDECVCAPARLSPGEASGAVEPLAPAAALDVSSLLVRPGASPCWPRATAPHFSAPEVCPPRGFSPWPGHLSPVLEAHQAVASADNAASTWHTGAEATAGAKLGPSWFCAYPVWHLFSES